MPEIVRKNGPKRSSRSACGTARMKKLIGIYTFGFEAGHPVPLELMEHQCEFSLRMLKEGRADGLIFEANSMVGMRMDSELRLRDRIERNKNTYIPD